MFELIIDFAPVSKKNNRPIYKRGNRPFLGKGKKLVEYEKAAEQVIQWQAASMKDLPIEVPVRVVMVHWTPTMKQDITNLGEAPMDILQKVGVIKNDNAKWVKEVVNKYGGKGARTTICIEAMDESTVG